MAAKSKSPEAIVCLYGNLEIGAGWLVSINRSNPKTGGGLTMLGTGEPVAVRTCTTAVWQALEAIRETGLLATTAAVRVFAAGGEAYADLRLHENKWYGDLVWNHIPAV